MKKDSIIQFVGFSTRLGLEEFVGQWEDYAREFNTGRSGMKILQQESGTTGKYKYVSQHIYLQRQDMRFAFMTERNSDHFAEQKVKVVQTGGYMPLHIGCKHYDENTEVKIMAFISHQENNIEFYRRLLPQQRLNIYEAYYESCAYGYIIEFFTPETHAADLLDQLKKRLGVEVGIYKDCMVPQL